MKNENDMLNERSEQAQDGLYEDEALAKNFVLFLPWVTKEITDQVMPAMNSSDLAFCRNYYQKEHITPSWGELRLLNSLVARRKRHVQNYVLSHVSADTPAILETYEDLLSKYRCLSPEHTTPLTLENAAQVSSAYMERIGRGDSDRHILPASHASSENTALTLCRQDGSTVFQMENPDTHGVGKQIGYPPETAWILLSPKNEDPTLPYEEKLSRFLSNGAVAPICQGTVRVGDYGIIGTLSECCQGIFADPRLLPRQENEPLRLLDLAEGFQGQLLLATLRPHAAWLCEFASSFDLQGVYFAKSTNTGYWATPRDAVPSLRVKLSFIRSLLDGKEVGTVQIPTENLRKACLHDALYKKEEEAIIVRMADEQPILIDELILSSVYTQAKKNCFSHGLNAALDAALRLVCRGVDRRCIGFSFTYGIPSNDTNEEALGNDLAFILGAYRVTMELAVPEQGSSIDFGRAERDLTCTAYASVPRTLLPSYFVRKGSRICYLSFRRNEDGLPDFESLRQMCDYFIVMAERGAILSARTVVGNPFEVMKDMAGNGSWEASELAMEYTNCFCQGILLETDKETSLPELGKVTMSHTEACVRDDLT